MTGIRRKPKPPAPIVQLRIELKGLEPTVWRCILVPETITLGRLHRSIQAAMGWTDSHLHEFTIAGEHYGFADADEELLPYPVTAETRVRLDKALQSRKTFTYLYDFGDSWEHRLKVEKKLPPAPIRHPLCVAGERACPPEDVGGPPGYMDFVRIVRDPTDPEHEDMLAWYGGPFDPAFFDSDLANRLLKRIKL